MLGIKKYLQDWANVIAPKLCIICGVELRNNLPQYCLSCRVSLPSAELPERIFSEIISHFPNNSLVLDNILCLYNFTQNSDIQKMIYALKYQGLQRLAFEAGTELGKAISNFDSFNDIDVIAPVPIHKAKIRERGYNQSDAICKGVASVLDKKFLLDKITRTKYTMSQTKLNAKERSTNVLGVFKSSTTVFKNKTVLLCDDVLTTGSTINECAKALKEAGAKKVYAATLARDVFK